MKYLRLLQAVSASGTTTEADQEKHLLTGCQVLLWNKPIKSR